MALEIGARVAVFGGQFGVQWLGERSHLAGTVLKWNPGPRKQPACVLALEEEFSTTGESAGERTSARGKHLVLHLRGRRDTWKKTGIVQVELFDHEPETAPWKERPLGVWVETHATYADISAGDGKPLPPNAIAQLLGIHRP
jgi:hypothetical protein